MRSMRIKQALEDLEEMSESQAGSEAFAERHGRVRSGVELRDYRCARRQLFFDEGVQAAEIECPQRQAAEAEHPQRQAT